MTSISAISDPAAAATATPADAMSQISTDKTLFLKMLTTQMQNQDPLNPMDATQYTQQLTQFSQVEQTIQQTQTLKDILSHFTTQDMAQASGLIGRDATFDSATSGLAGASPAQWKFTADRAVASVTASISNAAGAVVDTRVIAADGANGRFAWDGKIGNAQAPDGAYTVAMKAADSSGNDVPIKAHSVGTVQDAMNASGVVTLGVNGIQIPSSSLLGISTAM